MGGEDDFPGSGLALRLPASDRQDIPCLPQMFRPLSFSQGVPYFFIRKNQEDLRPYLLPRGAAKTRKTSGLTFYLEELQELAALRRVNFPP